MNSSRCCGQPSPLENIYNTILHNVSQNSALSQNSPIIDPAVVTEYLNSFPAHSVPSPNWHNEYRSRFPAPFQPPLFHNQWQSEYLYLNSQWNESTQPPLFHDQKGLEAEWNLATSNESKESITDSAAITDSESFNILRELVNDPDPKIRNSEFVKFLNKLEKGELEIKEELDENRIIDHSLNSNSNIDNENLISEYFAKDFEEAFANSSSINYSFSSNNPFSESQIGIEKAKEILASGNLVEGALALEAILRSDPTNALCWTLLGIALADNEEDSRAISALSTAIKFDPYNLEALLTLGVCYTNELQSISALKILSSFLFNHPDYQINEIKSAKRYSSLSHSSFAEYHKEVSSLFLYAHSIKPNDYKIDTILGVLYFLSSEYDLSEKYFEMALSLNSSDAPSIWNKLGVTKANKKNYSEAISCYEKALSLKPNYVRAMSNLGIAYANLGLHKSAILVYLDAIDRNPQAFHLWNYIQISLDSVLVDHSHTFCESLVSRRDSVQLRRFISEKMK